MIISRERGTEELKSRGEGGGASATLRNISRGLLALKGQRPVTISKRMTPSE